MKIVVIVCPICRETPVSDPGELCWRCDRQDDAVAALQTVGEHVAAVLRNPSYGFVETRSDNPNAEICYVAQVGDARVQIDCFRGWGGRGGWVHVEVAFGERRKWGACPLASGGLVSASSEFRAPGETPCGGSALPGYDIVGLKWRLMGVAPDSRTQVPGIADGYQQSADIVALLLSLRPLVADAKPAEGDLSLEAK
jgi:hypothetical protein